MKSDGDVFPHCSSRILVEQSGKFQGQVTYCAARSVWDVHVCDYRCSAVRGSTT